MSPTISWPKKINSKFSLYFVIYTESWFCVRFGNKVFSYIIFLFFRILFFKSILSSSFLILYFHTYFYDFIFHLIFFFVIKFVFIILIFWNILVLPPHDSGILFFVESFLFYSFISVTFVVFFFCQFGYLNRFAYVFFSLIILYS